MAQRTWALILGAIIVSGILIVHESAHYFVGKAFGQGFSTFSLGFGPVKRLFFVGETEVVIGVVPLGAYVESISKSTLKEKIAEAPQQRAFLENRPEMLLDNSPWIGQFLMVAAGPFSNLLLGWLAVIWLRRKERTMKMAALLDSQNRKWQRLAQAELFWEKVCNDVPLRKLKGGGIISMIQRLSIEVTGMPWDRFRVFGGLSLGIGILNFIPYPGLDGSKLATLIVDPSHSIVPKASGNESVSTVTLILILVLVVYMLSLLLADLYWFVRREWYAWTLFRANDGFRVTDDATVVEQAIRS